MSLTGKHKSRFEGKWPSLGGKCSYRLLVGHVSPKACWAHGWGMWFLSASS